MTKAQRTRVWLDPSLRALRAGAKIIHLAPRSFDVLTYLYKAQDRIVPKTELLEEIWGQGGTDHALRQEIYSLRRFLAPHGLAECVVTIAHYGYRFQATSTEAFLEQQRPALTEFHQRALAATAHFERKADTQGWGRALFWYQQLCKTAPVLPEVHLGAIRATIHLAIRSAISRGEAISIVRRHLDALNCSDENVSATVAMDEAALFGLLEGHCERALRALGELHLQVPPNEELEQFRSFLYLSQGQITKALASSKMAVDIAPHSIEMHLHHGFMLLLSGAVEEGARQFRFIRQLQPDNGDAIECLAIAMLAQRNPEGAIELASSTSSARSAAIRCVAFATMGEEGSAREALRQLLEARRAGYVSGLLLARCYHALGEQRHAVTSQSQGSQEPSARWFILENTLWQPDSNRGIAQ